MITRAEARERAEGPDSKAFKELEARIDRAVEVACAWSKWPCTVSIKEDHHGVVELVVAAYRSNGWNIGVVTDPRDGDFVQLEKP